MTQEEFISAIKLVVSEGSISSVKRTLEKPAGRSPDKELLFISNWYNSLSMNDKGVLLRIVKYAIEMGIFSFLCVLDGVSAIEDYGEKGRLELFFKKGDQNVLLNGPDLDYLHDLFGTK